MNAPKLVAAARPRSVAVDSAEAFVLRGLIAATAFVASVVVSRTLGPEGRGAYYLPSILSTSFAALGTLGLEQANVYLMSRGVGRDRLWAQSGLIATAMGVVGVAVLLAFPAAAPALAEGTPYGAYVAAAVTVPLLLHTQLGSALLALSGRVTWQFRATLAGGAIQTVILLSVAALDRLSVTGVLTINLVTAALTWIVAVWPFRGSTTRWAAWDPALLRQTVSQALPLHVGTLVLFLHFRFDAFLLKALAGTTALGYYSLSVTLAELLLLLTDSVSLALLPRQVSNTLGDAATLALRGVRANLLLGGACALLMAVLGYPVITLGFGPAFTPSFPPLLALLPGVLALGMQRACAPAALRTGRPWRMVAINSLAVAVNIALNLWWIPRFGILGAAWSSTVSYVLGASLFLTWTSKLAETPGLTGVLPTRDDARTLASNARSLWTQRLSDIR